MKGGMETDGKRERKETKRDRRQDGWRREIKRKEMR